ncbi:MAG: hypothetical protein OEL53_11875 [Rhodospirillales bacterium]|nr:hypothetical protein [Rhodospirillales bacterium]
MHPYVAKVKRAQKFRYMAMAAGLVWIFFMGWGEFFPPSHESYFQEQRLARKLEECKGQKASQRFDCKSDLLVGKQSSDFMDWTKRVAIVFGPPLLLIWLVTKMAMPKRPPPGGMPRERPVRVPRPDEEEL